MGGTSFSVPKHLSFPTGFGFMIPFFIRRLVPTVRLCDLLAIVAWVGVAVTAYFAWQPLPRASVAPRLMHKNLVISPDARIMVAGSNGNSDPLLWDLQTDASLGELRGHPNGYLGLGFAPDGRTLATGGKDGFARLWDVATCKEILKVDVCSSKPGMITPLLNDKFLVTNCDQKVVIWDRHSGRQLAARQISTKYAQSSFLVFAPDGRALAAKSGFGRTILWDIAADEDCCTLPGVELTFTRDARFSPDGKSLATSHPYSGVTRLWSWPEGQLLATYPVESYLPFQFSGDGKKLFVSYFRRSAPAVKLAPWIGWERAEKLFPSTSGTRQLDLATGRFDFTLPGRMFGALSPTEGQFLAFKFTNSDLELWDTPPVYRFRWLPITIAGAIAFVLTLAWRRGARRLKKMPSEVRIASDAIA